MLNVETETCSFFIRMFMSLLRVHLVVDRVEIKLTRAVHLKQLGRLKLYFGRH